MFGFSYEYLKSSEVFKNFLKISEYGILEFIVLIFGTVFIISMVFIIIPFLESEIIKVKEKKEKEEKKKMINRIVLQKNLEDIIARELNEKK